MGRITRLISTVVSLFLVRTLARCSTSAQNEPEPFPDYDEWNLLILSDSSNWGVGQPYAKFIEEDKKVKVNLHDCWVGSLSARQILEGLQDNSTRTCGGETWQKSVREAEVIVLFGNPQGSEPPDGSWGGAFTWLDCVSRSSTIQISDPAELALRQEKAIQSCTPESFSLYEENLGKAIDRIYELREGRPVILRMTEFYIPLHQGWQTGQMDQVCTTCMENFAAAIRRVAASRQVVLVSTMDALNGKDHMSDPKECGYIQGDGIHLSPEGAEFVARLLHSSGYSYAKK
jgi:hypothetical protein